MLKNTTMRCKPSTKLILFDLDGVLVDAKWIHFNALNRAIREVDPSFVISTEDHLRNFDGLPTSKKLEILVERGLKKEHCHEINERKQFYTEQEFAKLERDEKLVEIFKELTEKQLITVGVCSNALRKTTIVALERLGVVKYCTFVFGNDSVSMPKPHPEMYWSTMIRAGVLPEETLIIEDSPVGILAAQRSGARVWRVSGPEEITLCNIGYAMRNKEPTRVKWQSKDLNILIPMAGAGSRFQEAGYTFPKPLIEVNGKPMIQLVVENIGIDANYIFVVQKKHLEKYNLKYLLNLISPRCKIVVVDGVTEGAACTALLAKKYIDSESPLLFVNSDQFVEWDSTDFMYRMQETDADGGIVTFKSTHPKWSFARVNELGEVLEVAEKKPISDNATVGFYYWKHGSDFVKYAEKMIKDDVRVNGEFYVCPVFNEAISDGLRITTYEINKMWGLGTPEDLQEYLRHHD